MALRLELDGLSKRFTRKLLFAPVSTTVLEGEIIAITGENGRGKSTLLKMIAHVLPASVGKCAWIEHDRHLDADAIQTRLGYVAPYLELYDDLDAVEHLSFVLEVRKQPEDRAALINRLLETGLQETAINSQRRLRAYSSGMRQRVRIAMALAVTPRVLLLDEATSNLDDQGIAFVEKAIRSFAENGGIVIMATNEPREIASAHRELMLLPPAPEG